MKSGFHSKYCMNNKRWKLEICMIFAARPIIPSNQYEILVIWYIFDVVFPTVVYMVNFFKYCVNDIGSLKIRNQPNLFEDDTAIYYFRSDVRCNIRDGQWDLHILCEYVRLNKLTTYLNINKTSLVIWNSMVFIETAARKLGIFILVSFKLLTSN